MTFVLEAEGKEGKQFSPGCERSSPHLGVNTGPTGRTGTGADSVLRAGALAATRGAETGQERRAPHDTGRPGDCAGSTGGAVGARR